MKSLSSSGIGVESEESLSAQAMDFACAMPGRSNARLRTPPRWCFELPMSIDGGCESWYTLSLSRNSSRAVRLCGPSSASRRCSGSPSLPCAAAMEQAQRAQTAWQRVLPSAERPFIFYHVPRTGGTSLRQVLARAVARWRLPSAIPCHGGLSCDCKAALSPRSKVTTQITMMSCAACHSTACCSPTELLRRALV